MSTFTIRVTSSATNAAGTAYGQQPDLGTPSFLDMYITGSTDPLVPNGQYDAYCLNPLIDIYLSPTTYTAENSAGTTAASFVPIGFSALSQTQVDQVNWLLSQNFTSDAKYGGQYNFGEVQTAIWKLVGFTDAQISGAGLDAFITDNSRSVVSAADINFLTSAAQSAVASGNGVLPTDAFFSTVIDPAGNVQPLIVQLQSAKLGNYVWADDNANGVQDSGEAGVDKVIVELYDTAGKLIATTTTGDDYSTAAVEHGFYQFAGLHAGDYQVKFISPAYNFTVANVAGNSQDTVDSDADALTGLSHVVTLAAGQSNQTVDAGLVAKPANASLSGYVYEDFGNDGVRGAGEPAVAGVTIRLSGFDTLGNAVTATTVTNAAGFYEFVGLAAGTYKVTETQPGAYLDGKETAGSSGGSTVVNDVISNVVLAAGDNSVNNNFGELVGAQIRGTVYCDDNNNGTQQAGEVGLGGVTITLTGIDDLGHAVTATTVTAADGTYAFFVLRPGTYSVAEPTQPAGKLDGIDTAGLYGGGTAGNDVINNIVLTQGLISDNNNFGEIKPASVSGFVYLDAGDDGVKAPTESGIAGVTVTLTGTDDHNQPVLLTTVTGAAGSYSFGDLRPGSYTVTESQPAAYLDGKDTAGTPGDGVASNDKISNITLSSGENSVNNNFGELPKLNSISGVVFEDKNNDGIKDPAEAGIPGATVTLTGTDTAGNPVSQTTTTGADGSYAFNGVPAGTYTVTETQPAGYLDGKDNGGNSGGTVTDDKVANISLPVGVVTPVTGVNFGELKPACILGAVFEDKNSDGVKGAGEPGIPGATVTLSGTNDLGQPVTATVLTDANGNYKFVDLRPGTYTVTETQPAGYLDGKDSAGNSGGTVGNDTISTITLTPGAVPSNINFGEVKAACIQGVVFEDKNNDGVQGAGETGIAGAIITLTGTDDKGNPVSASATTAADGSYKFADLRPGNYTVTESQPAGYLDGKDSVGSSGGVLSNDKISNIPLGSGDVSSNNNFAELKPACILGAVFEDKNSDGVKGAGEPGIPGATVTLSGTNDLGQPVTATVLTDANGNYKFVDLRPGTYTVTETQPAGYLDGKDSAGNSGGTVGNDTISTITLTPGAAPSNINFGEVKAACIQGVVFEDKNNDGVQGAGETGIAGATITLTGTDDLGQPVSKTATTAADGSYKFADLRPGNYAVAEIQPAGYLDGKDSVGSTGGVLSNDKISNIPLSSGDVSSNNNFAELKPACILGTVFEDKSNDGVQGAGETGIPNATVTLSGTNDLGQSVTQTVLTAADGSYKFVDLRPGSYSVTETQPAGYLDGKDSAGTSGGTVTDDKVSIITLNPGDAPTGVNFGELKAASIAGVVYNDANNDGIKAAGEAGIAGATVTLTGTNDLGAAVSVTVTTAADGSYAFNGLRPGSYTVTETQPAGYTDGKDTAGSTGGTVTDDKISAITLGAGIASINNNFGELTPAKAHIGDLVFEDKNANGVQDAGEAGIGSVTVNLCDAAGNIVGTTTTDAAGKYGFDVAAGTYSVQVVAPANYLVSAKDVGGNTTASDAVDSDIAANGKTGNYVLAAGDVNNTVDAGLYRSASLGDKVWVDIDKDGVQDANEPGVTGVKVYLLDAAGATVGSPQTTDSAGHYLFTNLTPGSYSVRFDLATLPAGYSVTQRDAAAATDANDSDADPLTGRTVQTTLDSGEVDRSWDMGIQANVGIDIEKYVHGEYLSQGATGGEGLTPGFWKNHTGLTAAPLSGWPETGLTPSTSYGSIFGVNVPSSAPTLLDALSAEGGGMYALLRHSAAALLNTSDPYISYAYTKAQIVAMVQQAFASGDYETPKNLLATQNELGADLSTPSGAGTTLVVTPDVDADTAGSGPVIPAGGTAVFTYVVKNTGSTALSNISVSDDRIASLAFVGGDTNNDGKLDVTETWTYTAKEVASSGTIKSTGTVTALDAVTGTQAVTDKDDAYYTGMGAVATKGSIGDKVFEDKNFNGIQDTGEGGMAGVKVTLKGAGVDGIFGTRDDITATTTTLANGAYAFNDLAAGKYQVVFADTTGKGYQVTKANQGADDSKDSDIDASGATAVITLAAGEHNLTVDAGLYLKACVGDKVWEDKNHNNIQDVGEIGIGGIKVALLNAAGTMLYTTTTNASGNYQFSNVDPGSYALQFDKSNVLHNASYGGKFNMNNWAWGVKDVGNNDAVDSDVKGDANATTNVSKTDLFTLTSGQSDQTRDAAITPIVIDLDGNGIHTIARADSTGSFDLFGNGAAIKSGWISSGDGFLAVDINGNGKIDDISELFGGNAKGAGFASLASYDSNHDGLVNNLDADFGKLMIWQDANSNHSTDAGELLSLAQAGVASLTVAYTELPFIDAQGNMHLERSIATLDSGASVDMTDVYFNVDAADAKAAGVALPTMADLLGDDRAMDVVVGGSDMASTCQVKQADEACSANGGDAGEVMRRLAALTREDHHVAAA